jgi:hypothetical protein
MQTASCRSPKQLPRSPRLQARKIKKEPSQLVRNSLHCMQAEALLFHIAGMVEDGRAIAAQSSLDASAEDPVREDSLAARAISTRQRTAQKVLLSQAVGLTVERKLTIRCVSSSWIEKSAMVGCANVICRPMQITFVSLRSAVGRPSY